MSRRETPTPDDDRSRSAALQAASILLAYPDERLQDCLPLLGSVTAIVPPAAAEPLARIVAHLRATDPDDREREYVDTFDLRRRSCLFLTYYSYGDTRKRGMALLRFSHAYKSAGFRLAADELADHLPVVCEFAAVGDAASGLRVLAENRPALELIRLALEEMNSPYVDALDVVRAVLPPVSRRDLDRAFDLARTGPPDEEVGLEPFAPPEYMGGARR
jgi:nitrate reductase molybdenum cofactor assembly chaperone NarJ/NarW